MEFVLIKICKEYRHVIIAWLILLIDLYLFFQGYFVGFDEIIYYYLHSLASPLLTQLMIGITFFGSVIGVISICLICLFIHMKKGLWVSINVAIVSLLNQIIKNIVQRPRPSVIHLVEETSYSFPSAHSMVSMALFGMIAYMIRKENPLLAIIMLCVPIMIGITRIYLGVHYASDVLSGFLFAIVYLVTMISIMKYHKKPSET